MILKTHALREKAKLVIFRFCEWCEKQTMLSMIRQGYTDELIAAKMKTSVKYVRELRGEK